MRDNYPRNINPIKRTHAVIITINGQTTVTTAATLVEAKRLFTAADNHPYPVNADVTIIRTLPNGIVRQFDAFQTA